MLLCIFDFTWCYSHIKMNLHGGNDHVISNIHDYLDHVNSILYDSTYHVDSNLYRHVTDLILAGLCTM